MLYIGYLIILDGQSFKKSASEISIFELLSLENCISRLCPRGAHGSGYRGPVATTWVPMGAQVPVLSPNDPQNPS